MHLFCPCKIGPTEEFLIRAAIYVLIWKKFILVQKLEYKLKF